MAEQKVKDKAYWLNPIKPFNERFGQGVWPWAGDSIDVTYLKKQLDEIQDLGMNLITLSPDPYVPDEDVEIMTPAFQLALDMGFTLRSALAGGVPTRREAVDYPKHIHDFNDYNRRFVKRWAGNGIIWDTSNEPNGGGFWYNRSSYSDHSLIPDWVEVDRQTNQIIKQEDPNALALTGDVYRSPYDLQKGDWADEWDAMVAAGIMNTGDAISCHPYMDINGYVHPPEDFLFYMKPPENCTLPVVITEFNFDHHQMSEQQQAAWLVREFFIIDYMQIPFAIEYGLRDPENGDPNGWGGIFRADWTLNPAGVAIKYWLHELKGYYFNQRFSVGNDSTDFVFDYVQGTNHKLIGWTTGSDHQVNVNGDLYTISNVPQLLSTYTAPIKLVSVDNIWHLKDTLNTDFGQIAQFTTDCLTKLKQVYPELDTNANVTRITATTLGREFRLQVIQGSQQSVELLERVATVIRKIGHRLQLVDVPIPRTLLLRKEDYNSMIAALTQNINLIEQFV